MDVKKIKELLMAKKIEAKNQDNVEEVCVFPLPNVVLFPGAILPLHIFEDRYKAMTEELLRTEKFVAMSFTPDLKDRPSIICGAGRLRILEQYPDGRKDVFVEGRMRLKIVKILQKEPYIKALALQLPDVPYHSEIEERVSYEEIKRLTKQWIFLNPEMDDSLMEYVNLFTKPHYLADFLAYYFIPSNVDKQRLLETLDRKNRVEHMRTFLTERVEALKKQDLSRLPHKPVTVH